MSCSIFSRSIGTYLMVGIFINRRVNDYIGNVVLLNSFYALFDIKLICPVYLYNANSVIFREVDKMVNRFSNHSFIFAIPHNTHTVLWLYTSNPRPCKGAILNIQFDTDIMSVKAFCDCRRCAAA